MRIPCSAVLHPAVAPGPVSVINTTILNSMEVTVRWSPVIQEEANGEIQLYLVLLSQYGGAELNRTIVDVSAVLEANFTGLGKSKLVCSKETILITVTQRG